PTPEPAAVSVIDAHTNAVVGTVVLEAPSDVAISPDGRTAYVTNGRSLGDVVLIDAARVAVIGRIPVGLAPSAIAISRDGAAAYVANENSDSLSVIDTGAQAVIGTVPVGRAPAAIEIVQVGGSALSTPTPGATLLPTSAKSGSGCEIDHPVSQDHTVMLSALAIGLVLLRRGRSRGVAPTKNALPSTHRVDGLDGFAVTCSCATSWKCWGGAPVRWSWAH